MAVLDVVIEERVKQAIRALSQYARVKAVYVFGSQIEGKTDEFSDIDIGVFIEHFDDWDLRRRVRTIALVQEKAGDDLEIHLFPAEALTHAEPASFAAYILKHGIPVAIDGKNS
ncbi:MAG: nucleotidyltransferase domain-containing protein [Candidatus Abyssobacteria bacterium SURF_17]|uniref:Nucleotidyltransferase domain-containing protein n=1 Tax=Candidatus Abyssobacteria bacterium SURF_17 TaxID=2093361 RepID=A0A419F9G8_9BACT|nr:MAG: nucleotidyltransferase domain-containing protein [Candidatus Abyssubacteria bacterium SURF_17]